MYVANNKIYGTTDIPAGNIGCKDRIGFFISGVTLS